MKNRKKIWEKVKRYWRWTIVVVFIFCIVFFIGIMLTTKSEFFDNGKFEVSEAAIEQGKTVELNGQWELYYQKLLLSSDFKGPNPAKMDSYVKVPGSWGDYKKGSVYSNQGVVTYRAVIKYPKTLKDPALRIKTIASAYKIYINGSLAAEVGKVSDQPEIYQDGTLPLILALPADQQEVELIFQVANLHYAKGGIRESPEFGSKRVLERQRDSKMAFELLFIGGILIFGAYYLLLFILQPKNITAVIFSLLCLMTALRTMIWGEVPILIFDPEISFETLAFINYLTGYNLIPLMVLFIGSMFSQDGSKLAYGLVLLPTLFFEGLLLTSTVFMSHFTNYLYLLMLVQMAFMILIMSKAVLRNRENALVMFISLCGYVLTVNLDLLHYKGIGGAEAFSLFLLGNFAVLIAMSYVQAKHQADIYKKLLLYNANLVEADQLKDKIMATEMSFLQAQIKPHFLYNALNAIANVCEKDGQKASQLIIDLAVYLRGSLAFNDLDKMTTIEKELEFVDTYFHIEQARFGEKISLTKDIESGLDFKIPVLVLQPLVENAVRHGISKKISGGHVKVAIHKINGSIHIEISDDGAGIEQSTLKSILMDNRLDDSVGLLNINHRLRKLYGSGLEITSEVGQGTCVKFVIPEKGTIR